MENPKHRHSWKFIQTWCCPLNGLNPSSSRLNMINLGSWLIRHNYNDVNDSLYGAYCTFIRLLNVTIGSMEMFL